MVWLPKIKEELLISIFLLSTLINFSGIIPFKKSQKPILTFTRNKIFN